MKELEKSFKNTFGKELPIELDLNCPTHIPIGEMIDIVIRASIKVGIDSYLALKHFQFTDEEINEYFERLNEN